MTESTVLIVEDDPHLREALYDTLAGESLNVLTADNGQSALEIINNQDIGLVISDLQMQPMDGATLLRNILKDRPTMPAVLMTAYGTIENAVDVMRNGASDYLVKPFEANQLRSIVRKYLLPVADVDKPLAADPLSKETLRIAERVAATEATVTLTGESGSGKEVYARYIHQKSKRSEQPFVAINCAAIPENMLEAMLFGYEKGAFTGATSANPGKFEQANNGTLLLDEITEMDLGLQAKLLRVIQEKEVERIGGRKAIALDVRVLATSNRDLKASVAASEFREDLYYRLNVFPLHIPPLRLRPGDILPLAELFLSRQSARKGRSLSATARQKLLSHNWPGNVRELDNLIQRSLILASRDEISADELAFEPGHAPDPVDTDDSGLHRGLKDREFQIILDALASTRGHRGDAATALNISPRTLRYKLAAMRKQGIAIPGDSNE
ncbi:MAG: sigma-54-dependent Fis family transcriptional regulator [Woeseiaceae bacterium]|nr:sigma-54-dependent Fis family transcriptional regulator [Woeseiaceae bacterium]